MAPTQGPNTGPQHRGPPGPHMAPTPGAQHGAPTQGPHQGPTMAPTQGPHHRGPVTPHHLPPLHPYSPTTPPYSPTTPPYTTHPSPLHALPLQPHHSTTPTTSATAPTTPPYSPTTPPPAHHSPLQPHPLPPPAPTHNSPSAPPLPPTAPPLPPTAPPLPLQPTPHPVRPRPHHPTPRAPRLSLRCSFAARRGPRLQRSVHVSSATQSSAGGPAESRLAARLSLPLCSPPPPPRPPPAPLPVPRRAARQLAPCSGVSFLARAAALTPGGAALPPGHVRELQWLVEQGGLRSGGPGRVGGHGATHWRAVRLPGGGGVAAGGGGASARWRPTAGGWPPTHYAAAKGTWPAWSCLLRHSPGCVNLQTRLGATPLYWRARRVTCPVWSTCAGGRGQHSPEGPRRHERSCTPATHTGHHALVVWLATFTDLSLSCQDREGATALHFAASRGAAPPAGDAAPCWRRSAARSPPPGPGRTAEPKDHQGVVARGAWRRADAHAVRWAPQVKCLAPAHPHQGTPPRGK
ncbi:unnamed protein product [Arctogadus glacialis]